MEDKEQLGNIRIADEVVSIVAGLAATEVDGVAGMSGGIAGGIAEMLGRKNLTKGVKIEAGENECVVDLFVIMDYGHSIPDVSWNIQSNVKEAIEGMTGLDVIEVNVHVQGVHLPEKEENHNDEEQEEQKEE
jgi:uncharacterized alkaline shock family protein YloU